MDNERKAAGGGELAQRIRQRYSKSPGVIPMAVTQNLINRMRGFGIGRLPLLADWQRRWAPAVSAFPGGAAGLTYAWPTEFFRPPYPPSEGIRAIGDNRMARTGSPASPRTPIVVARVQSPPERSAAASSGRESFPNTAVEKLQPGEPEYRVAQNTAQAVSSSGAPGTAIVQRQVDNPRQQAVPLHAPAVGTPLARTGGEPEPVRVQRHTTDPTRQAVPANHPDSLTPVVVARGPSPPERPAATSSRRESFPNTAVGQLPPGEPVAYGVAHSVASQGEPGIAIVQRQMDNPRQQAVPLHAPAVETPLARTGGEPEPARVQRHAASPTRQAVSANHPDSLTPSARTGGELGPAIVQRHSVSPTRQALPDAGADGVLPARQGDEWGPAILQHHLNSPLGQTVQRVRVSPDWAASSPAVAARQRSAQPVAEAHLTVPLPPARPALANDADRSEPIQPADVPSNGGLALAATPLPSPLLQREKISGTTEPPRLAGSPDSVENFPLPPGGKRPEREGAQGQELVATLQRRLAPTLTRLPQAGGDLPAFVSSRAEPGRVGSFAAHVSGVPAGSGDNMAAHVSGVPAGGVDNIAVHPTVPVSFSFPGGGRLERGVSHGQELAIALQRHTTPTLTRLPQRGGDLVNLLVLSTPVNLQTAPEVSQGTAPAPAGPPPRPAGTGMEQQSAAGAEGTRQSPEELERLVDKLLRKLWRQLTVERERRGWQRWP